MQFFILNKSEKSHTLIFVIAVFLRRKRIFVKGEIKKKINKIVKKIIARHSQQEKETCDDK